MFSSINHIYNANFIFELTLKNSTLYYILSCNVTTSLHDASTILIKWSQPSRSIGFIRIEREKRRNHAKKSKNQRKVTHRSSKRVESHASRLSHALCEMAFIFLMLHTKNSKLHGAFAIFFGYKLRVSGIADHDSGV